MRLRGILDRSLDNFLCLRGFASMGDLYEYSEPAEGFQRELIKLHEKEMLAFLRDAEFLFFPEVILCATLCQDGETNEAVEALFRSFQSTKSLAVQNFGEFTLSYRSHTVRSKSDSRVEAVTRRAVLNTRATFKHKFSRIDGNHRLSATAKDQRFRALNTPFCLLLFRNTTEAAIFSRALFHNINYKQVPLTMEQNLKLILDEPTLFPDDKLKTNDSFGWPYYHARKLHGKLDHDLLPNLVPFLSAEPRTFLLRQFEFLIAHGVLADNDNALKRLKEALVRVNACFDSWPSLKDSRNTGLLAALLYYELKRSTPVTSFVSWVLNNHLHLIEQSNSADLIAIFDKVLESRNRTVFVSMPFGKDATENHFKTIQRVVEEINESYPHYKPPLKVERVDFLQSGTSFPIRAKIDEFMANCGLLIGDLTYCNPNVYHEIGFMDGKAKAEGRENADVLLFLDESVPKKEDKMVGFNLRGTKYIPFKQSEEFARLLRENLEKHFKLRP